MPNSLFDGKLLRRGNEISCRDYIMMPQLPPNSKAIGFKPLSEDWNYYSIDDGYVVGVKLVMVKIMKSTQTDQAGLPVYAAQHQIVIQVLTQEDYRNITSRNSISK